MPFLGLFAAICFGGGIALGFFMPHDLMLGFFAAFMVLGCFFIAAAFIIKKVYQGDDITFKNFWRTILIAIIIAFGIVTISHIGTIVSGGKAVRLQNKRIDNQVEDFVTNAPTSMERAICQLDRISKADVRIRVDYEVSEGELIAFSQHVTITASDYSLKEEPDVGAYYRRLMEVYDAATVAKYDYCQDHYNLSSPTWGYRFDWMEVGGADSHPQKVQQGVYPCTYQVTLTGNGRTVEMYYGDEELDYYVVEGQRYKTHINIQHRFPMADVYEKHTVTPYYPSHSQGSSSSSGSGSGSSSYHGSSSGSHSYDPDDYDVEGYYGDNQDSYYDYDDAYDDFDDSWDDY